MARTVRQLVALGVTMAFAISGGSDLSLSKEPGQAELGMSSTARSSSRGKRSAAMGVRAKPATASTRVPSPWTTCSGSSRRGIPTTFLIHDALDDDGVGTTRVQAHATIRYTIPLPPWVSHGG